MSPCCGETSLLYGTSDGPSDGTSGAALQGTGAITSPLRALGDGHLQLLRLTATENFNRERLPEPVTAELRAQAVDIGHGLAADRQDHVADQHARLLCRAARLDGHHQETGLLVCAG